MNTVAGFITLRTLVVVVLVLVALGMFGINVEEDVAGNEDVQDNVSYVATGVTGFWNEYLAGPASFIWNDVFVGLIWESFIVNMQRLRNGQSPSDFDLQGDLPYPTFGNYVDGYEPYQPVEQ